MKVISYQLNVNVKTFLLSRTDIERLLIPLLRVVYEAEQHSTHHMYMILIILLMLTLDDAFSSYVHDSVRIIHIFKFKITIKIYSNQMEHIRTHL